MAKNEIEILKDLDHPHIVSYYGAAIKQDLIVIFLEYMSGFSLRKNLKQRGVLTEESVIKCAVQVAEGLRYIHFKDIVHTDIKCTVHNDYCVLDLLFISESSIIFFLLSYKPIFITLINCLP